MESHTFFSKEETSFLRSYLGEYYEVIRPTDICFIMKNTGLSWDNSLKHLALNHGDINLTIMQFI